jgi:hypothetical protein
MLYQKTFARGSQTAKSFSDRPGATVSGSSKAPVSRGMGAQTGSFIVYISTASSIHGYSARTDTEAVRSEARPMIVVDNDFT